MPILSTKKKKKNCNAKLDYLINISCLNYSLKVIVCLVLKIVQVEHKCSIHACWINVENGKIKESGEVCHGNDQWI